MRVLVSVIIFLLGLLIYVFVTPEDARLDFIQTFLGVAGLFLSTTIAMNILEQYVLSKFEKDKLQKTIADVVHKDTYEKTGVYNISQRRSQIPTFGDILQSFSAGEIWVFATSLSSVVPQYLHDIEELLMKGKIDFRFLLLDPDSLACIEYGKSVEEEETLGLQIRANIQHTIKLKTRYPHDAGPFQVRLSNTVPHASFIYVSDNTTKKQLIYYSPYRQFTPGIDAMTIELHPPIGDSKLSKVNIYSDVKSVMSSLWERATTLSLSRQYYPEV